MNIKIFPFKKWVAAIVVVLGMTSACEQYLEVEPVSLFANENIFENVDYTRQTVLGIYQLMTRDEGYSKRLSLYYGLDTDISMCSGSLDNGRRGVARYAATSGNTEINAPYRNLYAGIERANICVANIPNSSIYADGTDNEKAEMKRMYGEALTLRALNYFELIRNWGDVPFKTTPSQAGDNFDLPKTDRDVIYEQLIADLTLAETLVPWRSGVQQDERITKGAVKGLLARIALARGGYSLRRESNKMERRSDYITYYTIARDQCKEIIESGEHGLNPDFGNVFKTMCELKLDATYGEAMWEVAMGNYTSGELAYYLGNKIEAGSSFGKSDGGVLALPNYYYAFDSKDTRRDITIAMYALDPNNVQQQQSITNLYLAKWRREWIKPEHPGTDKFAGINWILLRYSDVLLIFAEAENEINNAPTQAAKDAFRAVRERAFKGNTDAIGEIPTDYEGFFKALVEERKLEFGGEAIRKYDLIRWNLLGTKLTETKAELLKMANREAPYENFPYEIAWRNKGDKIEYLNFDYYIDPLELAVRDEVEWPNSASWGENLTPEYINSIAEFFVENRKELLPIHQSVIDESPSLSNDYGY